MESLLTVWLPVLIPGFIAILILAATWGTVLSKQKSMREDIDATDKTLRKDYLTLKAHGLICENERLKFEAHVTQEIQNLKTWITDEVSTWGG